MAAVVELIPAGKLTANTGTEYYWQPTDTVVDVSGYTEAAVFLTVYGIDRQAGTVVVNLETAPENRNEQYVQLVELQSYSADPGEYPSRAYVYLMGSSTGSSTAPGFGRFLRVSVAGTAAGWSISMGLQLVLKP